jgi:hypothetical protein
MCYSIVEQVSQDTQSSALFASLGLPVNIERNHVFLIDHASTGAVYTAQKVLAISLKKILP